VYIDVYIIVHTFAGACAGVAITPDGQIILIDPAASGEGLHLRSLEGITYPR